MSRHDLSPGCILNQVIMSDGRAGGKRRWERIGAIAHFAVGCQAQFGDQAAICLQPNARSCAKIASASSSHCPQLGRRSEEHTSELQSLMRTSYAVFCVKKHTQRT